MGSGGEGLTLWLAQQDSCRRGSACNQPRMETWPRERPRSPSSQMHETPKRKQHNFWKSFTRNKRQPPNLPLQDGKVPEGLKIRGERGEEGANWVEEGGRQRLPVMEGRSRRTEAQYREHSQCDRESAAWWQIRAALAVSAGSCIHLWKHYWSTRG